VSGGGNVRRSPWEILGGQIPLVLAVWRLDRASARIPCGLAAHEGESVAEMQANVVERGKRCGAVDSNSAGGYAIWLRVLRHIPRMRSFKSIADKLVTLAAALMP